MADFLRDSEATFDKNGCEVNNGDSEAAFDKDGCKENNGDGEATFDECD